MKACKVEGCNEEPFRGDYCKLHSYQLEKYGRILPAVPLKAMLTSYDTGWINRSDWTNVHLGSDDTKDTDSNVTHNLDAPLSDLLVKVLVSTDGTDANSFEIYDADDSSNHGGVTIYAVDDNTIKVQTGINDGLSYVNDAGAVNHVTTNDWYYKIKVWKLG